MIQNNSQNQKGNMIEIGKRYQQACEHVLSINSYYLEENLNGFVIAYPLNMCKTHVDYLTRDGQKNLEVEDTEEDEATDETD